MKLFSYVITHDYGFAPNPFGGVLTLATCKPDIRKSASVGDWIIGTGSLVGVGNNRLIYAGLISEVTTIESYGSDYRYEIKIPNSETSNGRKGDNIYFITEEGGWEQRRNPFHGEDEIDRDLKGKNVLVCESFWYFGDNAPLIPDEFSILVKKGPKHKINEDSEIVSKFIEWVFQFRMGIQGQPSSRKMA
ncbi:hypothetical protein [Sulfurimonas sp.]|jgi:hypothetical protein|uniref:Nmad2 family putative nucleotide modification protein n=1 Tax=Sulfurimonas sp. TaxID=2022749 RepID=UPI002A366B6D|nr:hypothetical protein [Sulfurimonas sp.]MDY0123136.1 hypothetical protein [Sulfurimonas sp.]